MATITVRQLSDDTHARLRVRAAEHGRSVEAEVRAILDAATEPPKVDFAWRDRILALGEKYGDAGAELADLIPPRDPVSRPVPFVDY
jgi:plasmid stability protein